MAEVTRSLTHEEASIPVATLSVNGTPCQGIAGPAPHRRATALFPNFDGRRCIVKDKRQLLIGGVLILLGLIFLLNTLGIAHVDLGDVIVTLIALALIFWGARLILRARRGRPLARRRGRLLGDLDLRIRGTVTEDLGAHVGLGELRLDLTEAEVAPGEHTIHLWGWLGDIEVQLPRDLAAEVHGEVVLGSLQLLGRSSEGFFLEDQAISTDYQAAEARLRILAHLWIGDLKVMRVG